MDGSSPFSSIESMSGQCDVRQGFLLFSIHSGVGIAINPADVNRELLNGVKSFHRMIQTQATGCRIWWVSQERQFQRVCGLASPRGYSSRTARRSKTFYELHLSALQRELHHRRDLLPRWKYLLLFELQPEIGDPVILSAVLSSQRSDQDLAEPTNR